MNNELDPQSVQEFSTVSASEVDTWLEDEDAPRVDKESQGTVDAASKYAASQLRVVRETKDYQLDYLQHALTPGRELIDISPAYQRRLRWGIKKKSLLIESFLLNIPVPPVFLFEKDYNEYEVIDGRQRLDAITTFLSNNFELRNLEYWPELNGQRFHDLPKVLQKGLLRRSLPAIVLLADVQNSVDDSLDVRRVLFDRLNTGGVRLNPQELRNALYPGRLNQLLVELARSDEFASSWGIPLHKQGEEENPPEELLNNQLYAKLVDTELVLRVFALDNALRSRKGGSLRSILDDYMMDNVEIGERELENLRSSFLKALRSLKDIFEDSIFRLPNNRLSRPLYDALMIAALRGNESDSAYNKNEVESRLRDAFSRQESYDTLVGRGNTMEAVRSRVDLASWILDGER